MRVILKRDVKGLGLEGDVKDVKDGYARNFLFPSGAAAMANAGELKNWERHRAEREEREQESRAEAEATAARLQELSLQIAVKSGEKNRLFGSVTTQQIAELIASHGIEVDRHAIHLREPIKTLGEFRVDVKVAAGIDAQMVLRVVAA
ncbi:MAG TPA: 50S ribosomal protein L9 [Candidatus Saccharimonadales bacterium]|nr:50S ribosomal protein L9 [Candidatus Saccharimonadales bacterium]